MKRKKNLGFTMIELLIVIAVLGVLAVAVLSAINPIEQINRGRDTGSRSDAEQLLSAVDRFYASMGYYPWQTSADDLLNETTAWGDVDDTWLAVDDGSMVLESLSSGGTAEIKTSFVTRITGSGYNTLMKYNRGTQGDSTYICFTPKSGSFKEEALGRCVDDTCAGLPGDLEAAGCAILCNADDPMICLP
ncbi:MAG: type II secretion system protein [Patescibacteria group bacterium]|nr:type II secretion system GspH family protein [Patescibacteria group bacterium]